MLVCVWTLMQYYVIKWSRPPRCITRPGVGAEAVSFLLIIQVAFTVHWSTHAGKTWMSVFIPSLSWLSVWLHGKQHRFIQRTKCWIPPGTNSDMVHAAFVWINAITSPSADIRILALFPLHSSEYCVYIELLFTFVLSPAQEFLTHEGYFVPDSGSSVGRGDVARFMLSLLSSNAWVKKGVAMTIKQ